jgi:hypothetical protein
MLIDGHRRAETTPTTKVPVLVLDVTEAEAGKILLTIDPISAMAEADKAQLECCCPACELRTRRSPRCLSAWPVRALGRRSRRVMFKKTRFPRHR